MHRSCHRLLLAAAPPAPALELHGDRSSPFDLAVTGRLAGIRDGETLYARWSDLRALPSTRLTVDGEFMMGPQVLTVVFLSDLWRALPTGPGADSILATCADGYVSVYTSAFIKPTTSPITVRGRFKVQDNATAGLFFEIEGGAVS